MSSLVQSRRSGFDYPVAIDTDVNAPAASELADLKRDAIEAADGDCSAADAMQNLAYVTVGTGVGVGIIVGGEPVGPMLKRKT